MPVPDRRLAAILAADIVGYSRLMREDANGTLAALRELRHKSFEPAIRGKGGDVVKRMGDGWLVEFSSVVDAVNCAIEVQESLRDHPLIKIRIGIHIGDIVHEEEDIYGDGVNIAARLQERAEPGGIALSAFAHDSLDGVVRQGFRSLGQARLKNISQKIEVFGWGTTEPKMPAPAPATERPALLVLPFTTIGGGSADSELLAEGITEAVITACSRFSWFLTCSRNTSNQYKGKAADLANLRRDQHVSYVLESNIRTAGARVRVSAELLDTRTGNSIWSDRFDGSAEDPFELEDKITRAIIAELTPRIVGAETRRARTGGDGSAWDLMMQGRNLLWRINREDNAKAEKLFLQAIRLEPDSGLGQSDLAWAYYFQSLFGWSENQDKTIQNAVKAGEAAVAADDMDAYAYVAAAMARCLAAESTPALALARRAIDLNYNLAAGHAIMALALFQTGRYDEAMESADTARNLSPRDPLRAMIAAVRSIICLMLDRYDLMTAIAEDIVQEFPEMPTGWRQLAVAYAETGQLEKAQQIVNEHILKLIPGHSALEAGRQVPFGANEAARNRWVEVLVKAGLPRGKDL